MESVAFHHAGKSSAFAQPCYIHDISGFKEAERDLASQINPFDGFHAELSQELKRTWSRLLEMATQGFIHPLGLRKEAELYRIITVLSLTLLLNNGAGASFDDRHGDDSSIIQKDLGHSYFSSNNSKCLLHRF